MLTTLPKHAKIEIKCKGAGLVPLDSLIELQGNLKDLSDSSFEKFVRELIKDGFSEPISVWLEPQTQRPFILNGHQRLRTLKKLKEMKWDIPEEIPVSIILADNEKQARRKCLALAAQYGEMTGQGLYEYMNASDISVSDLEDFRFPEIDIENLVEEYFKDTEDNDEKENLYTDKIKTPLYEPKGPKPQISELFNTDKTDQLISYINSSNLPEDEKLFLLKAAERHTVFNYEKIAEYYAHSEKETQDHMERSALIIIDFNKAIENGFIDLTKDIAKFYEESANEQDKS